MGADVAPESDQGSEVRLLRKALALHPCLPLSGSGHFLNVQVIGGCVSKIYTDVVLFYSPCIYWVVFPSVLTTEVNYTQTWMGMLARFPPTPPLL